MLCECSGQNFILKNYLNAGETSFSFAFGYSDKQKRISTETLDKKYIIIERNVT